MRQSVAQSTRSGNASTMWRATRHEVRVLGGPLSDIARRHDLRPDMLVIAHECNEALESGPSMVGSTSGRPMCPPPMVVSQRNEGIERGQFR